MQIHIDNLRCRRLAFSPRLISKPRVDQLAAVNAKVRTRPEEVEAWFDTEITKANDTAASDVWRKIKLWELVVEERRIANCKVL